jgi:hypothetical protein
MGMARAYAMQGDTTKARVAYQDFLTLWKGADPDIPILQQAKSGVREAAVDFGRAVKFRSTSAGDLPNGDGPFRS